MFEIDFYFTYIRILPIIIQLVLESLLLDSNGEILSTRKLIGIKIIRIILESLLEFSFD